MTSADIESPPRESTGLGAVQRRRRFAFLVAALAIVSLLPFLASLPGHEFLHEAVEIAGILFIGAAIVGRTWCTLYIGGRKSREIVDTGPYSISRNPLYLFSLIGIAGIGAQTGSILMGPLLATVSLAIFLPVILREEEALARIFGSQYLAYRARVPRFGPKLAGWKDMQTVTVEPRLFWRTARDTFLFLLAMPLCEAVEGLQEAGYLVPLVHLP